MTRVTQAVAGGFGPERGGGLGHLGRGVGRHVRRPSSVAATAATAGHHRGGLMSR